MHQEIEWIEAIVPDMIEVMSRRYTILKNVAWQEPVGRRSLAQILGMSERVLRTETDLLRKYELISSTKSGMILTDKGHKTILGLSAFMDSLLGIQQLEKELSKKLGIARCLVVPGNCDDNVKVVDAMGKIVTDTLKTLLPLGKNIIAAMGGTTMACVATCLTSEVAEGRELLFVPARGGVGERVDIQANNVCAQMALCTGGSHRSLYVPEQVSETTFKTLLKEPAVQDVVELIEHSNAVLHSIGEALHMANRRSMSDKQIELLKSHKAVGEAFGYFFDEDGKVVYKIPRVGLQLKDLASMNCIIAVAGGVSKAKAIAAYMHHAPSQTYLVTDEGAAKTILKGQ